MSKIFVGRVTVEEMTSANGPWTKTRISFNREDLDKLALHMNEKGYVNLNFNRSKKGNEYCEIDTWQPSQSNHGYQVNPNPVPEAPKTYQNENNEDVPF